MARGVDSPVEVRGGKAESIPYKDGEFDAVVACWILHYVTDLEKSLTEVSTTLVYGQYCTNAKNSKMARVVDPKAPNARIVIVQGSPDNEVVNLINRACAPIAERSGMKGSAYDHQGYLLAECVRVFTRHGFGKITLKRSNAWVLVFWTSTARSYEEGICTGPARTVRRQGLRSWRPERHPDCTAVGVR